MPLKLLTALPQHSLSYLHQRRFSAHCISGASQPGAAVNREADHRGLATACRNILDYRCRWLTLRSRKISRHVACRYIDRPLCSRDFLKPFRKSRRQHTAIGDAIQLAAEATRNKRKQRTRRMPIHTPDREIASHRVQQPVSKSVRRLQAPLGSQQLCLNSCALSLLVPPTAFVNSCAPQPAAGGFALATQ